MRIKERLYQACLAQLKERTTDLENRIAAIAESRNNETKSSAGDKYETSRAMMQMEEDKVMGQLELAKQMHSQLRQLNTTPMGETILLGSLVKTSLRNYYLSIGLGKVILDQEVYYCISIESPIGRLLLGEKVGGIIRFNGIEDQIQALQ